MKIWLKRNLQGDPIIWAVAILLALISIAAVYSSSGAIAVKKFGGNTEAPLFKHIFYIAISFALMWLAHKIDYRYYSRLSLFALIVSVPLLIAAIFIGTNINDASRWLRVPGLGITFQPSDLAKFALIAYLSAMLAKKQQVIAEMKDIDEITRTLVPMLAWCGLISGLIIWSNASTGIVLFSTCMLLLYIGRVPMKYLMFLAFIGMFVGGIALFKGERWKTFVKRIEAVSQNDPDKIPFQLQQSYIAIATGGVLGKGPGNSTQRNFLPHPYSDFIFAIILEEYGIWGGIFVLFLFLVLLYRGMMAVANSERAFGGLLSAGLSFILVIQAFVNMGVAVGLGPITGLPLPFVSMGGTSLVFTGISLGIILSVSKGEVVED
ncbi:MAG: FtsW/RodA/SpoVE family cell cycle protein [Cytophagales bacterium]|nr:FtsW/RodA/SpoVE family cell cycle protein [Cytophagales bacterium]